ncbi:MAG: transposase [Fuerstiella sp.]
MRFIGADLHRKSITFCVVEIVSGKTIVHQRMCIFCCETDRIAEFPVSHEPYQLVVEASIGYEWFASLAEKTAERVVLAPVREAEARAVLATMPGVGPVTIETVLAELGDWRRLHNADAVVSFAGLDPGVRDSYGRRKNMHLTKVGSPLPRWIKSQLAHRMKRTTARWQNLFEQISRRVGKKKATCAIARRLLLVVYAMLRDGQAYRVAGTA